MKKIETEVDLAYSYLLELAKNPELMEKIDSKMKEKIVRRVNFLKAKLGSYEHQLAEELYNTLDSIMLVAKVYGEKVAEREAAKCSYDVQPLLDILAEDTKGIDCSCNSNNIYEIYQKVKRGETSLGKLYRELQPYSKIVQEWKKCNKEEILAKNEARKRIYQFKSGIVREKRRRDRIASIPYLALMYGLMSQSLLYALTTSLYLSTLSLGREGITRMLEKSREIEPRYKFEEKAIKAIDFIEKKLQKIGLSLPYLIVMGTQAAVFGVNNIINYLPSFLTWVWGVPLAIYAWRKTKPIIDTTKAYVKTLVEERKLKGIKEKAKKYAEMCQAKSHLEKPPDPSKKGLLRKVNRFLSTLKLPLGKERYIDFSEFPHVLKKRMKSEDLEQLKLFIIDELKKDYSSEIVEIVKKDYLPYIHLGEETLIKAIGIMPTVSAATLYVYKENARKFGEETYYLGEPAFLRYITEEIIKQRGKMGSNIIVRKKTSDGWVEAPYTPEIFDHKDDFRIIALKNDHEELILGVKYEENIVRRNKISIFQPFISKISKNFAEKLMYKKEKIVSYCEGSSVKHLENVAREGLITQVPRISEKGIDYALEEYEIYLTDLATKESSLMDMMHEVKHVANNIEAWEETKQIGKKLIQELFIQKQA
jgi:hypothetical protein